MREVCSGVLGVQKSKFYAHVYRLEGGEDPEHVVADVLREHRRKYKKAVHHCWALRSSYGLERYKDDGEVGHPGKVLLEVLRNNGLEEHIIVVSRIFGGVKLGVGGVSRAFREVAENTMGMMDSCG